MANPQNSQLLHLAQRIQTLTNQIITEFQTANIQEPTFNPSSSHVPETAQYSSLRGSLNDAALDLLRLVNGPVYDARTFVCTLYDLVAWQVACEFNFFQAIPEYGSATVQEVSKQAGLDVHRVGRFLRLLATQRVFEETEPDIFRHTARSALLLRDAQIRDAVHYQLDEYFKAAAETSTSMMAEPYTINRSVNPFVTRHGAELFSFYKNDTARGARFANAMAGISKAEGQLNDLSDIYPWSNLAGGKIIDVGGGSGHTSIHLAQKFPELEFMVQDSLHMLRQASQEDLAALGTRISLMQHSFFDSQPVMAGVSAYLIRNVTHNWDDEDCARIFKALVPALERSGSETPVLINDIVLSDMEMPRFLEQRLRQVDIMMMVAFGGKQRTKGEFEAILKCADPRYRIKALHGSGNPRLLEVVLDVPECSR